MNRQALAAYVYNERARRASALAKGGGVVYVVKNLTLNGKNLTLNGKNLVLRTR